MTDADRKVLTEYIGECWPEYGRDSEGYEKACINCGAWRCAHLNRTFTTMPDLIALFEAIHGEGRWESFFWWVVSNDPSSRIGSCETAAWLFCLNAPDQISERMKMAAGWIRERSCK